MENNNLIKTNQESKYVISLDASTSKVGIAIFEDMGDWGKFLGVSHVEIDGTSKSMDEIYEKVSKFSKYFAEKYAPIKNQISKIIIEEPLISSAQITTATLLNKYAGMMFPAIYHAIGVKPEYVTVDDARRYALPELSGGKNNTLMGAFPQKIAGRKRSDWTKFLIMYLICSRYKQIEVILNKNLSVDVCNFDRADSIVVGLGYMIKHGYWSKMANFDFWGVLDTGNDKCLEVIEKNLAYAMFLKSKEFSALPVKQKSLVKEKYLNEVYRIKNYFNVNY